jgi:hypothetical protein
MSDADITISKAGFVAFRGTDAVHLLRVRTIMSGIKLHLSTGGKMKLTRGSSITKLLELASTYTGKDYKRTQAAQAWDDLNIWSLNMASGLKIEQV